MWVVTNEKQVNKALMLSAKYMGHEFAVNNKNGKLTKKGQAEFDLFKAKFGDYMLSKMNEFRRGVQDSQKRNVKDFLEIEHECGVTDVEGFNENFDNLPTSGEIEGAILGSDLDLMRKDGTPLQKGDDIKKMARNPRDIAVGLWQWDYNLPAASTNKGWGNHHTRGREIISEAGDNHGKSFVVIFALVQPKFWCQCDLKFVLFLCCYFS